LPQVHAWDRSVFHGAKTRLSRASVVIEDTTLGNHGKHNTDRAPSSPARGPEQSDPSDQLRECGEIAAVRLSAALSESLRQAADLLFGQATQASGPHEREPFLDAAELARMRRQHLESDFRRHFEQRYERACRQRPDALSAVVIDFDASQLRIVEHDRLEDTLDAGMLTEAIETACWETLYDLTGWFRGQLGLEELKPRDVPIGPRLIGAAVTDALRDQLWRHEAKHRLARALCRHLPGRVSLLYRDLLDYYGKRAPVPAMADGGHPDGPMLPDGGPGDGQPEPQAEPLAAMPSPASTRPTFAATEAPTSASRQAAEDAVRRCLADASLPPAIRDFLNDSWRVLLARIHLTQGPDSPAWRDAIGTMTDLAWSLAAKPRREDCMRLMESLPGLLRRLDQGLEVLGASFETRNRLFMSLSACHAEVVTAGLSGADGLPPATPLPAPAQAAAEDSIAGPAPSGDRGDRADTAGRSEPSGGNEPFGVHRHAALLGRLCMGMWLRISEPEGGEKDLKLAWISPHRSVYLLTNRQGKRALSLTAEDLADLFRTGRARLIPPPQANADDAGPAPRYRNSA
jgi:hypothetical protein